MNQTQIGYAAAQRNSTLVGLASVIARRIIAVKEAHTERGTFPRQDRYFDSAPMTLPGENARQFTLLCHGAKLASGPVTTADMQTLAVDLVPEYLARFQTAA
jgi:hypothetical protein